MNIEAWLILAASGVLIPCVTIIVRELLNQRTKIVAIEVKIVAMENNCIRHQKWQEEMTVKLTHTSNNVVRLCQAANVKFEGD